MQTLARNFINRIFPLLLALALVPAGALAQERPAFLQEQLDQMLAPIALYPDALLSHVLMASTYPLEAADAARWSRNRPGLAGDDAVRAAQGEGWDPSVLSLVAFPQVLARMAENPEWTRALGDAFLNQQAQVMDTVQYLRRKAQAAGTLLSDDRLRVLNNGQALMLQPADPQVVYVPYYDPFVAYGSWWWPAYPPVHWAHWPGYYARPGVHANFFWGAPVGVSVGFFFGNFDWPQRHVHVAQVRNYYYNTVIVNRPVNAFGREHDAVRVNRMPERWAHDPAHRRGVEYHNAPAPQRYGGAVVQPEVIRHEPSRRTETRTDLRRAQPEAASAAFPVLPARPQPAAQVDARRQAVSRVDAWPQPTAHVDARPQAVARVDALPQSTAHIEARPQALTRADAWPQPAAHMHARPQIFAHVESRPQAAARVETRPQPVARVEPRPQPAAHVETHAQPAAVIATVRETSRGEPRSVERRGEFRGAQR